MPKNTRILKKSSFLKIKGFANYNETDRLPLQYRFLRFQETIGNKSLM